VDNRIAQYIVIFLVPFTLSLLITPGVRLFALKNGFVSYPRADRWHKHPTALLGGASIYIASVFTAFAAGAINLNNIGLCAGATFLFIIGLVDDKNRIKPYTKLFFQIIAACIAVFSGAIIRLPVSNLIAIPLTLIWIVGVTNSFNLLDNIDGLAGGVAAISLMMIFFSSLILANNTLGIFSLALAGAALGFLPYNFNPAKIFMGDSGSMFLGYSLAVISISGTARHISNLFAVLLIPVFILSVPIFDTIFVMIGRRLSGKRVFEGGTDHTSHRLIALGLSPRKTVLLLYAISAVFGFIALFCSRLGFFVVSVIGFLAIVISLFFGAFLSDNVSYNNGHMGYKKLQELRQRKTILDNMLLYKRRIVEILLDLAFICIAYYSAYFLRFEGAALQSNLHLAEISIIWLILIKISVFYIFGLYRGVWKYISVSDLITVFKAVTLGSVFCVVIFTFLFRFQDFSRAVFFIDWLLLMFLVAGSRILFRVLGELFSRVRRGGKNILIFGAGDAGELAVREIKRNKSLGYNLVGFIDDDPSKAGYRIQGVPVLGGRDSLEGFIHEHNIEEVIIAVSSLDEQELKDIARICRACGVSYRRIKGILDGGGVIDGLSEE